MEALDSGALPTTAIGPPIALSAQRVARELKTTAELLANRGQLPRHLRGALDTYAALVATAMFVGPCEEKRLVHTMPADGGKRSRPPTSCCAIQPRAS